MSQNPHFPTTLRQSVAALAYQLPSITEPGTGKKRNISEHEMEQNKLMKNIKIYMETEN